MDDIEVHQPGSSPEKAVTRLVNPAGFVLVLLLFLFLPSVAVSCDVADRGLSAGPGSVRIEFSGAGIALDEPHVDTAGSLARTPQWEDAYAERAVVMDPTARVAVIVTLILMLAGAGTAFARTSRKRSLTAAIIAGAAAILLVVTELLARAQLESAVRDLLSALYATISEAERTQILNGIGDAIETGLGFWLTLAWLGLILAINAVLLIWARPKQEHTDPPAQAEQS